MITKSHVSILVTLLTCDSLCSSVELNVGVTCSCVPVSFVALKRVSTASWEHARRFFRTRRPSPKGSAVTDSSGGPTLSGNATEPQYDLPKIPRATLTGLRTLFRGNRTNNATELTEMSTYAELQSVDDYHSQLKRAQTVESVPSHPYDGKAEAPLARPTLVVHQV